MRVAKTVEALESLHMSLFSQGPENHKEPWQCRTVTLHNPRGTTISGNVPLGNIMAVDREIKERLQRQTAPWFYLLCQVHWLNRTCLLSIAMCTAHLHSLNKCPYHRREFEIWQSMPNYQYKMDINPKDLAIPRSVPATTLSFLSLALGGSIAPAPERPQFCINSNLIPQIFSGTEKIVATPALAFLTSFHLSDFSVFTFFICSQRRIVSLLTNVTAFSGTLFCISPEIMLLPVLKRSEISQAVKVFLQPKKHTFPWACYPTSKIYCFYNTRTFLTSNV